MEVASLDIEVGAKIVCDLLTVLVKDLVLARLDADLGIKLLAAPHASPV